MANAWALNERTGQGTLNRAQGQAIAGPQLPQKVPNWSLKTMRPLIEPWSRRDFMAGLGSLGLSGIVTGAVGAPAARSSTEASLKPLRDTSGPNWSAIQEQFTLIQDITYLNNGSLGPCPRYVIDETVGAWNRLEQNPVELGYGSLLSEADQTREKVAKFLGCSMEEIALTRNTTEGMNAIAQGLNLREGQRVLTTDHEHPGGSVCWEYYQKRRGISIDRVNLPVPPASADDIVRLFEQKLTQQTRVISVSHITYSTGLRLPIRKLADLAEAAGALLVVDGAQGPGWLEVDLDEMGCAAYVTSAHKWLLAPKGSGILYIRSSFRDQIEPLLLQHGYRVYTASTGTRNIPGIIGLGAAVDFLSEVGKAQIEERTLALRELLCQGLRRHPRVTIASPDDADLRSPLVTVSLPDGVPGAQLGRALREKHGVVVRVVSHGALNGIRISTHFYNTAADVEKVVGALAEELG